MQGAAQSAVDSLRDETEKLRAEALSQRSDISKTKAEVGAVLQGALCRHASCWLILIKLSDAHYQRIFTAVCHATIMRWTHVKTPGLLVGC